MPLSGEYATPKLDAQRDTIWQQAEQALGTAIEVRRLSKRLVETIYSRGDGSTLAEEPRISPSRPGFIGVLDDITHDLVATTEILQSLLQKVGESGRAPTAAVPDYSTVGGVQPSSVRYER